jgi:hypothetical protein
MNFEHLTDGWTNLTYKFQLKSNEMNYIIREYLPTIQRIIIFDEIQFELNFISYLFKQYQLVNSCQSFAKDCPDLYQRIR